MNRAEAGQRHHNSCKSVTPRKLLGLEPRSRITQAGAKRAYRVDMKITVILCTYNRCASLEKALESAAALSLPESTFWEILVVDNNSRDETRDVVGRFCQEYPGKFRYIFEPTPGKSHALNTGLQNSDADILAFMDDDVIVEPSWLQNLTANLHNGEWAGAGGRILANWTFPPPKWLWVEAAWALAPLAIFDLGKTEGELKEAPFGTNMAFRREVFQKYGGFRTDLGPQPGSEIRGEDTEFGDRLLAGGERLRYESSAVVYHSLPEKRIRKDYFLAWWYDKGRSEIRSAGPAKGAICFRGVPISLFRNLAGAIPRWLFATKPSIRFHRKRGVWWKAGQIVESYRQHTEKALVKTQSRSAEA